VSGQNGWDLETSLDVQWVHAIAPGAHIILVEANSNSYTDLLTAEDYATSVASIISNSWASPEFSGESYFDHHFDHQGVSYFFSSGDNGLPALYPSSSPKVISVGGTSLHLNQDGSVSSETGWNLGGGGCSSYEQAPQPQYGFVQYSQAGCGSSRGTPDLSAVADPATGVSVFDSYTRGGLGAYNWLTVGGTSAAAPIVAAIFATRSLHPSLTDIYGGSLSYRDITSGNNGAPCLVGYDLCSGRGRLVPALPPVVLLQQRSLVIVQARGAPTTLPQGSSFSIFLLGGSGSGAITISAEGTGCSISGTTLTTTVAPTTCVVSATKAGDLQYLSATSNSVRYTFTAPKIAQTSLVVSNSQLTYYVGDQVSLNASGGSGNGLLSYNVSGPNCYLTQAVLSAQLPATCTVLANKASDDTYLEQNSSPKVFTFLAQLQTPLPLVISNGVKSFRPNDAVNILTTGGSGSGLISYSVTGSGCVLSGSGLHVTVSSTSCIVIARQESDGVFRDNFSDPVTFSFAPGVPQQPLRIVEARGSDHITGGRLLVLGGSGAGALSFSTSTSQCYVSPVGIVTSAVAKSCDILISKGGDAVYVGQSTHYFISLG
jgi:hypothetical protein